MTSINRWLHVEPQLNVHDRLVSGTSPRLQSTQTSSPRAIQGPQNGYTTIEALSKYQSGADRVDADVTRHAECSTLHNSPADPQRSSTTSSITAWIGQRRQGGLFSQIPAWFPGSRQIKQSEPKAAVQESVLPESSKANPPTSASRFQKRVRGRKGTNKSDSDEDRRGNGAKKPKTIIDERNERYACFFYQRCPSKNQHYPSCSGNGFDTIHHLKDHLKRCHKSKDRAELRCPSQKHRNTELVTDAQWIELKGLRKFVYGMGRTEKWNAVYRKLFPGEDFPSAYVKTSGYHRVSPVRHVTKDLKQSSSQGTSLRGLSGFGKFVSEDGSGRVAMYLETANDPITNGMTDEEKSLVVKVVPTLLANLLEGFLGDESTSAAKEADGDDGMPRESFRTGLSTCTKPPQLPHIPSSEPLATISASAPEPLGLHVEAIQQEFEAKRSLATQGEGLGRLELGDGTTDFGMNLPPVTVNPAALSYYTSDNTTGYDQHTSSVSWLNHGLGGGSLTTAPPMEAGVKQEDLVDDELEAILNSATFDPGLDVGAMLPGDDKEEQQVSGEVMMDMSVFVDSQGGFGLEFDT